MKYNNNKKYKKNVIIVDSGIDMNDPYLNSHVIGGVTIYVNNENHISYDNNYLDENGHGTFCAKTILSLSNDVGIYVIKILNKELMCSIKVLIEALKYIKKINVNLVCLSLATSIYSKELEIVCNELKGEGKILVASKDNMGGDSYPASFKSVIGVEGVIVSNSLYLSYKDNLPIQCKVSNMPFLMKRLNNNYKFFRGNSKSNAFLCGLVIKYIDNINEMNFKQLEERIIDSSLILEDAKANTFINYNENQNNIMFLDDVYKRIFKELKFADVTGEKRQKIFTSKVCTYILNEIYHEYGIEGRKDVIPQYVFYSPEKLLKYLNL